MSAQRKAFAARLGITEVDGVHRLDHKSLIAGMGGVQGIVESVLPGLVFVIVYAIWLNQVAAVVSAVSISVAFILARLLRKQSALNAVFGLLGIGLSAFLALREGGSGRDYFLNGIVTNAAYGAVFALSLIIRFPLVGLIIGFILGEGINWRKNKYEMRIFTAATFVLFAVFAVRLLVEVPLYIADQLESLAIAKLVLGLPLYVTGLWLNWLLVRGVLHRRSAAKSQRTSL